MADGNMLFLENIQKEPGHHARLPLLADGGKRGAETGHAVARGPGLFGVMSFLKYKHLFKVVVHTPPFVKGGRD